MCLIKSPNIPKPAFASTDNAEATNQADRERRLRMRRAGPAADVLTGASGIPATGTMGGVAR